LVTVNYQYLETNKYQSSVRDSLVLRSPSHYILLL